MTERQLNIDKGILFHGSALKSKIIKDKSYIIKNKSDKSSYIQIKGSNLIKHRDIFQQKERSPSPILRKNCSIQVRTIKKPLQVLSPKNATKKNKDPKKSEFESLESTNTSRFSYSKENLIKIFNVTKPFEQPFKSDNIHILKSGQFITKQQIFIQEEKKYRQVLWIKENKVVCRRPMMPLQKSYKIEHPNILQIYGMIKQDRKKDIIVGIQAKNSLRVLLKQYGTLNEQLIKKLIKQIALGIKQLHSKQICHGNLNLNNIYTNIEGNVLIDTTCVAFSRQTSYLCQDIENLYYVPLQKLLNFNKQTFRADIWALGCITLELFYGFIYCDHKYHPYNRLKNTDMDFYHSETNELVRRLKQFIGNKKSSASQKKKIKLSDDAQHLIKNCLFLSENCRPNIDQVLQFTFFK